MTRGDSRLIRKVVAAGVLSLVVYLLIQVLSPRGSLEYSPEMLEAARSVDRAITLLRTHLESTGIEIDEAVDPNRTGLIGPDYSPLTTTLGDLEAKRTTTNPDVAALIVHLLTEAGVTAGDTVAVGCSASFPALMIASLAAVEALDAYPVSIISIGASSYGATDEDFNLLDIHRILREAGFIRVPAAAISLGGKKDVGEDFEAGMKEGLLAQIRDNGIPFIYEPDLRKNVEERMRIYKGNSAPRSISAFVNIGGSYANFGTSSQVLRLSPGLNTDPSLPPESERGMIFEFAARGVPVIHLLYIKGLALKYGLPWDPVPLPEPGSSLLRKTDDKLDPMHLIVSGVYLAGLLLIVFWKAGQSQVPECD